MTAWTAASVRARVARLAVLGFLSLAWPNAWLFAQTVSSPQAVEFDPSPDHNTTQNSFSLVERYTLAFYVVGQNTPLQIIDLGKPSPGSTGKIHVDFSSLLGSWPADGVTYEARVTAVGPGGSSPSTVSNSFVFPAPAPPVPPPTEPAPLPPPTNPPSTPVCNPSLSAAARSVGSGATSGSLNISNGTGCNWGAVSDSSWLTVTSGANSSGSAIVTYSVAANPATTQRVGRIVAAGLTFTLTQAALTCTYSFASTSNSVGNTATTGSVGVTAPSACSWTASSSTSWLTISGDGSGSGNGTVDYSVAANSSSAMRSATITVGGATFTLNQGGQCTFTLSPTTQNFDPAGGTGTVTVTAGSGCSWTATRSGSWITITSGSSGSGPGTVKYRVSANSGSSARTGTLTIAGQPVTIRESAATAPNAPGGLRVVTVR
jgi:hypothetical protein